MKTRINMNVGLMSDKGTLFQFLFSLFPVQIYVEL